MADWSGRNAALQIVNPCGSQCSLTHRGKRPLRGPIAPRTNRFREPVKAAARERRVVRTTSTRPGRPRGSRDCESAKPFFPSQALALSFSNAAICICGFVDLQKLWPPAQRKGRTRPFHAVGRPMYASEQNVCGAGAISVSSLVASPRTDLTSGWRSPASFGGTEKPTP